MNKDFLSLILTETQFPEEAVIQLKSDADTVPESDFDKVTDLFFDNGFNIGETDVQVCKVADKSGISPYSVWLLLLLCAAERAKPVCMKKGMDEQTFWDTFEDLRYKAYECMEEHGVWGNFVAFWYPIFYRGDIVKLGRLEYEDCNYFFDTPYKFGDTVIGKGYPVKSVHIPASGEPLDSKSRLESYKAAYKHFRKDGGPLVMVCESWLLYPPYKDIIPKNSNILGFMSDFDIIECHEQDSFGDGWRVFGHEHVNPPEALPERTSLQRALKQYILDGKKTGFGNGVMIFDGEKIINK